MIALFSVTEDAFELRMLNSEVHIANLKEAFKKIKKMIFEEILKTWKKNKKNTQIQNCYRMKNKSWSITVFLLLTFTFVFLLLCFQASIYSFNSDFSVLLLNIILSVWVFCAIGYHDITDIVWHHFCTRIQSAVCATCVRSEQQW